MNNRTMKPLVWDEGTAEIKALWHGDRYVTIATVCVPAWHEDAVSGAREAGANAAHLVQAWNSHATQASRIEELEAVRAAAQVVFDGLLARIDNAAPTAVPVFAGIAELSDALSALNGEQG